jgi:hypothetical protein
MTNRKKPIATTEEISKPILNPFGTTFEIEVNNYLGVKKCVVAFPDRKTFYSLIKLISSGTDTAEYEAGERILFKCMVSGDKEFEMDDVYILEGAMECVEKFIDRAEFIKKK